MKVNAPAILTREALPDAPDEEWLDTILDNTNSFNDQVSTGFKNKITISDNLNWGLKDVNLRHGVETEVQLPWKDATPDLACVGLTLERVQGLTLASDGKPTGAVYNGLAGTLAWRPSGKPSGSVYVTVQYAPPVGAVDARMGASQVIPATTVTAILHNTDNFAPYGALSHSPTVNSSRIYCAENGFVSVSAAFYGTSSTGLRACWIGASGVATRYGYTEGQSMPITGTSALAMSDIIRVTAGQYLESVIYVDTGTGGTLTLSPSFTGANHFRAIYVAPDPSTTGKCTLLFKGP